ncbi:co-chaperone YbbN [uncultured Caulobacter sp.]|uniref:thioredoxin family protein n=1 Tax=uncultured Caulobacter sp. TaxID=158749 RepID=UPI002615BDB1|nr:thioredoxin family protein [uncultured Caulobacter sp.]
MAENITVISGETLEPIDAVSGERLQMLVFSASWCGPCKAMAPAVEDIAREYADSVAVAKIDIEASPGLARQFEVRGVPTLVVRRGGQQLARHVGGQSRTRLAIMLDKAVEGGASA